MTHILSLSYGKDSLACLEACKLLGYPIDRVIHAEVGVLPIPENHPPDYRAYHPGSYQVRHDQRGRVRQERHLLSRYRRDEP